MTVNMLKREKKTADWASMLSPHAVDGLSSEEEEEEEEERMRTGRYPPSK